jgi:hypothetical protein
MAVQPDPAVVTWLWQLLPIESLQARLFESVWYLHSQPPLFNLLVGAVLHVPGDLMWLRLIYWEVGFALVLVIFSSLRAVAMPRMLAHALVLLFSANPTPALYENFFLYSHLEAFLVVWAMFTLLRRPWSPAAYGIVTTLLVGMRALFQPVWAVSVALAIYLARRNGTRRRVSAWLLAPVLAGVLLVAKNGLMFDVWTTSSWYGLNAARLPYVALLNELPDLAAKGIVSNALVQGPFLPFNGYSPDLTGPAMARARERYGAPTALFREPKDDGFPNFNHVGLIPVSQQLAKDVVAVWQARPGPVTDMVARGFRQFLLPASDYYFITDNRIRLRRLDSIARAVLYPANSTLLVGLWLVLGVTSSAWLWLRPPGDGTNLRPAAAFVCLTTLWVTMTGNLTEFGENNRFRYTLDPMLFAWNSAILWWVWARTRSRHRDTPGTAG